MTVTYAGHMAGRGQLLRALVYHRIEPFAGANPNLAPDLISATVRTFERQMRYLARAYHPIDTAELLATLRGDHELPRRSLMVTFDDGYRSFLDVAWPILQRFRIPVVMFVATAFVDQPARVFWWDAVWQMVSRSQRDDVELAGVRLKLGQNRSASARTITEWLKRQTPARRGSLLVELERQLDVTPLPGGQVLCWSELQHLSEAGVTIAPHSQTHELLDQIDDT